MNAFAAAASLVFAATDPVKTTSCCSSAGNGPTTSRPGAVNTLMRNTPRLGLTFSNRVNDLRRPGLHLGLGFHRLADAKSFEDPENLGASRACRYGGDGLRFKQRLLQRFGRADVRPGSARAHCDPEAYASNVGCRPSHELRPSGGVLEHLLRDNTKVERSSGRGQLDQFGGGTEAENKFVSGSFLKLHTEFS